MGLQSARRRALSQERAPAPKSARTAAVVKKTAGNDEISIQKQAV
jgi:hypothetical protein